MAPPPSSSSSRRPPRPPTTSMLTSSATSSNDGHSAIVSATTTTTFKGNNATRPSSFPSSSFLEIGQLQLMDLPNVPSVTSSPSQSTSSSSLSLSPLGVRFSIVPSIQAGGSSAGGGSSSSSSSPSSSSSSNKSSSQHCEAVPKQKLTAWSGPPTQQQQHTRQYQNQRNDGTARTSFRWDSSGSSSTRNNNNDNRVSSIGCCVDGSCSSSSTNCWKLVAPLKVLYHSKLKIEVLYRNDDDETTHNAGRNNNSNNTATAISRLRTSQSHEGQQEHQHQQVSSSSTVVRYEAELPLRSLCINQLTKKQLTLKMTKEGRKEMKIWNEQQIRNQSCIATSTSDDSISRDGASASTHHQHHKTTNGSDDEECVRGGGRDGLGAGVAEPTIKFKLFLSGPLRPIVATCLEYFRIYCTGLDHVQDRFFNPVWTEISKQSPIILSTIPVGVGIGSVPVIATAVVVSPIVVGVSILFFPITIPIIVLGMMIVSGFVGFVATILATSRPIRTSIYDYINDQQFIQQFVLTSPVYQSLIYDTGDDDAVPNPISILRWYVVPETMWYRLMFSLAIDLTGSMSYIIPVVGESFDGPWGPIQSMLIMALYNQTTPNLKYVSLAEEWLPFTDILPSATIGWLTENIQTLIEEWNDLMEGDSMMKNAGINFRFPFLTGLGGYKDDDDRSNSSTNNTSQGNGRKIPNTSDDTFPPAQKREILREMQNLSGRLSVNAPQPPTKLPPRPNRK